MGVYITPNEDVHISIWGCTHLQMRMYNLHMGMYKIQMRMYKVENTTFFDLVHKMVDFGVTKS